MPLNLDRVLLQFPSRDICWFDEIESTMIEAARQAASGCVHGTVIGAEYQTAGQGRLGRHWHSPEGVGLYFSIVLRLGCAQEDLPIITLALGLAVSESIQRFTGLDCDLRWPNDVLINERKVSGILVHLHGPALVAGIGINVNQIDLPDDLRASATSLRIASGREFSREDLLSALLVTIDQSCELLEREGRESILRAFSHASSYVSGRRVVVEAGPSRVSGVTDGLSPAGFLMLRRDDGSRSTVIAGGVRPA